MFESVDEIVVVGAVEGKDSISFVVVVVVDVVVPMHTEKPKTSI